MALHRALMPMSQFAATLCDPNVTDRSSALSKVKTRTADQPLRRLLVPAAVLSLSAAFVIGAGAVSAQDDSIDGTWTVDTSIGSIDDGSGTFVGFRVDEVLDPGGVNTAVGRTPDVSGQIDVVGTVIESIAIEADLTTLATDNDFRNGAVQRTLQTGDFPTATFVSTEPVDLGQVPPEGEVFAVSVPGTLTIKDVSQDIVVDLEAGRGGDTVVVVGTLPITFGDFGVTMPSAPIVVSVEDSGALEWQIFFTQAGEMTNGETPDEEAPSEEASEG
jgi:polyisoprenoid-binding protein YceI